MPVSLCFPDKEKSCFACCPPIRPAGYEHIQYKNIIQRTLRENSRGFNKKDRSIAPITGFNCWGLGYIDKDYKLMGCLLHPSQNRGVDLRYRIDYGDKCRRETCQEEKWFSSLGDIEQRFWLHLADGLESFAYSSRKINPLFMMIGWGTYLLSLIAAKETGKSFTGESFFRSYPFFTTEFMPKGNAYLLNRIVEKKGVRILTKKSFRAEFEEFSGLVSGLVKNESDNIEEAPFVHTLDIDPVFTDFLRLSALITRSGIENTVILKRIVDEEIESFNKSI
ncbi:MAG: hypothetical protein JW944_01195 [Deltaproteobacteria bacterium]|nr:hypothetical protein [Deltaproteobacteria bacterium]